MTRAPLAAVALALILHAVWLQGCVSYRPAPLDSARIQERVEMREDGGVRVASAALGRRESERLFGIPLARNGIQPVWIEIGNREQRHYLFFQQTVDADYFSPREAAYKSHFSPSKRFLAYAAFGLLLWPLLIVAPVQYFSARHANGRMDELFAERSIGNRVIRPGDKVSGFVFTHLDEGTKKVKVGLLTPARTRTSSSSSRYPGSASITSISRSTSCIPPRRCWTWIGMACGKN